MARNILQYTDLYKPTMHNQYPEGVTEVHSYIEARSGGKFDNILFHGPQGFVKEWLLNPITKHDVDEMEDMCELAFNGYKGGFNRSVFDHVVNAHGGFLPLDICALPEGLVIPTALPSVSVRSTDPLARSITTYIEPALLPATWYASTVATISQRIRTLITGYMELTCDNLDGLPFKLHDFGVRGASSFDSAAIGGVGHLISFLGTDNVPALFHARKYYHSRCAGFSIPAMEHSTVTSWGRAGESEAFRNMLRKHRGAKILACVSDSYDLQNAVSNIWGNELKPEVLDSGATVVVRPDCYSSDTEILTDKGFMLFKDLTGEELVAQYTPSRKIEFVTPTDIINQEYEGEMIRFFNNHRLDILVTPNHRMVKDSHKKGLLVEEASTIKFHASDIIRHGSSAATSDPLSPFERLLIAFQADGSYPSKYAEKESAYTTPHINIRFNFQKKRKVNRLTQIVKDCGFKYKISVEPKRGRDLDQVTFYVEVPRTFRLSKTFDWVAPYSKSAQWCEDFIEELSHWDSTIRSETRIKYDTTIALNAEVVQQVAVLCNFGCTYGLFVDSRKDIFSDVHSLTLTKGSRIEGQSVKREVVNYKGTVHCVKVPSGMLVVRRNKRVCISGNSGDPVTMVIDTLRRLNIAYGSVTNSKGFRVLNNVRVIQGDGVDEESIGAILAAMLRSGYSVDNIAFGMGGALLQHCDRDWGRWAMKCSEITFEDGTTRGVAKDPITDPGKKSKTGKFLVGQRTIRHPESYHTGESKYFYKALLPCSTEPNLLQPVYRNGELLRDLTLEEIRENSRLT